MDFFNDARILSVYFFLYSLTSSQRGSSLSFPNKNWHVTGSVTHKMSHMKKHSLYAVFKKNPLNISHCLVGVVRAIFSSAFTIPSNPWETEQNNLELRSYFTSCALCARHTAQCMLNCTALKTAHCTLKTAHCTLHTAHCTPHTAHFTLHTAHCTLQSAHCTLYTENCTLQTAHCTIYTANCKLQLD